MRALLTWVLSAVLLALAVAAAIGILHYIPFDGPSYAVWIGVAAALVGLVSLVKPPRFLAMTSRSHALAPLLGGVLLVAGAILWPVPSLHANGPHRRLDDFLPDYQFTEVHEARTRAPLPAVLEAVRAVSFADMPVADLLMRVRGMAGGNLRPGRPSPRPILDLMMRPGTGFLALDTSEPGEVVYGMVGRPWANQRPPRVGNASEFLVFDAPGQIRVAFDIRVVDEGDGVLRVATETRSLGNDDAARLEFARYWRVIYPGSAIIRRVWLDAIVARAEGRTAGGSQARGR